MKDKLVSFETAHLARDKGFQFEFKDDENYELGLHSFFRKHNNPKYIRAFSHWWIDTNQDSQQWVSLDIDAPTQSVLRKWLREVHNIHIELIADGWGNDDLIDENICYRAFIWEVGKPKPGPAADLGAQKFEVILEVALFDALLLVKTKPKLVLGQRVYHEEIYNGKEQMKIVGIRENQVELEGDYSGGTHNVCQKSWLPIKGIII